MILGQINSHMIVECLYKAQNNNNNNNYLSTGHLQQSTHVIDFKIGFPPLVLL